MGEYIGLNALKVTMRRTSVRVDWTCVTIMRGSESDHYRCPFCSLFFRRGQELFLGEYQVLGVSNVERGAE